MHSTNTALSLILAAITSTAIVFSGWEIGQEIMTGAGLRKTPEGTPVRRAYELYNGLNDRQSWDQTAVLYAVRGLDGERPRDRLELGETDAVRNEKRMEIRHFGTGGLCISQNDGCDYG